MEVPELLPIEIMDSDWNEHYIWGQLTLKLPITITIIINLIDEAVEYSGAHIEKDIFGWCGSCGTPNLSDTTLECSKCGDSLINNILLLDH